MKKFSIYWLFCFVTLQSFAQTDASLSVTDTPPNWPFMLSSLNSSQITSGILYDKSNGFSNLYNYNLDQNNLSGKKHFFDALNELHRASDMTKLISVDELQNRIATTTSNNTVDVGIINTTFQKLNFNPSNPTSAGLLFQNEKFALMPGRIAFTNKKVLIAATLKEALSGNSFVFNFKNNLILNNATANIKTLTIDFEANGVNTTVISNGNIVIPSKTIAYTTTGFKLIKFVTTFTDNSTITTYSKIYIHTEQATQGLLPTAPCNEPLKEKGIHISTIPFKGYTEIAPIYGLIEYSVFYADGNNAKQMRKPIIVVDGFDPKDKRKIQDCDCEQDFNCNVENATVLITYINGVPVLTGGFNTVKYESLEDLMDYNVSPIIKLNLIKELRTKGYDVIIVNNPSYASFNTLGQVVVVDGGADYIERNAMTLVSFMQKIKGDQNLVGSTESMVLMGPSMGGQITRYALAHMEKKYAETGLAEWKHNTSLWVSVDSPHLGANIPVGAQANIYFLGYKMNAVDAQKKFSEELNSVAGKQQIISQLSHGLATGQLNNSYFNQIYYNNLNTNGVAGSNGYPMGNGTTPFRKIALINGSLSGAKIGVEQQTFLYMRGYYKTKVAGVLGAAATGILVPVAAPLALGLSLFSNGETTVLRMRDIFTPHTGFSGSVFQGDGQNFSLGLNHWNISHPKYSLTVSNQDIRGSLDNVPGGYFETSRLIKESVEVALSDAGVISETRDYIIPHSFIPSFSALGHLNPNQYWGNPLNTNLTCSTDKQTPFDTYFGKEMNSAHVSFSKEAANFLYEELRGNPQAPYFPIQKDVISGTDALCQNSNATYTIADLCKVPSNVISWSVTGNLAIVSQSGNSVVVTSTNAANTTGTVVATFQNGQTTSKTIVLGKPIVTNPIIVGSNLGYTQNGHAFAVTPVAGATSYNWTVSTFSTTCATNTGIPTSITNTGNSALFLWTNCPGIYIVTCAAVNDCGSTIIGSLTVTVVQRPSGGGGGGGGGGGCITSLEVNPNPVARTGTIALRIVPDPCGTPIEPNALRINTTNEAKIYDMQGNLRYSDTFSGNSFQINNVNLTRGNYVLNVITSSGVVIRKVIIMK